jgi:hypothetical protein
MMQPCRSAQGHSLPMPINASITPGPNWSQSRLAGKTDKLKRLYSEAGYLAVETAFQNWEAIQKLGR